MEVPPAEQNSTSSITSGVAAGLASIANPLLAKFGAGSGISSKPTVNIPSRASGGGGGRFGFSHKGADSPESPDLLLPSSSNASTDPSRSSSGVSNATNSSGYCSYSNENGLLKFTITEPALPEGKEVAGAAASEEVSVRKRPSLPNGTDINSSGSKKDEEAPKRLGGALTNSIAEFMQRSDHGFSKKRATPGDKLSSSIRDFLDRSDNTVKDWKRYQNKRATSVGLEDADYRSPANFTRSTSVGVGGGYDDDASSLSAAPRRRPSTLGVGGVPGRATSVGPDDYSYLKAMYGNGSGGSGSSSTFRNRTNDYSASDYYRSKRNPNWRATSVGVEDYSDYAPRRPNNLRATSVGLEQDYSSSLAAASRRQTNLRATSIGRDDGYSFGDYKNWRSISTASRGTRGTSVASGRYDDGADAITNRLRREEGRSSVVRDYGAAATGVRDTARASFRADDDRGNRRALRATSIGVDDYQDYRGVRGTSALREHARRNYRATSASRGDDDDDDRSFRGTSGLRENARRNYWATSASRGDDYDDRSYRGTSALRDTARRNYRATSASRGDDYDNDRSFRGTSALRENARRNYRATSAGRGDDSDEDLSYLNPYKPRRREDRGDSDFQPLPSRRVIGQGPRATSVARDDIYESYQRQASASAARALRATSIARDDIFNEYQSQYARSREQQRDDRGTSVGREERYAAAPKPRADASDERSVDYSLRGLRAQSVAAAGAPAGGRSCLPRTHWMRSHEREGGLRLNGRARGFSVEPDAMADLSYGGGSGWRRSPMPPASSYYREMSVQPQAVTGAGGRKFLSLEDECNWEGGGGGGGGAYWE